ncbi:MAG: dprA [Haloplasmataceae bacterium]|jgi:DNA processing protein|nr:dprA [Haloplasmataceae bacterium]
MNNIKDVLLKLHYLELEVNEIYKILHEIYQYGNIDNKILQKVLKNNYDFYCKLNLNQIKYDLYSKNIKYVTIVDYDYPKKLENIFMPPLVLFYQGDYDLINKLSLAVIGSRNNTKYGEKVTQYIIPELIKNKFVIISGLAYGIDSIAHRECIKSNGKTIAILGSGFDHIYPKENKELAQNIANNHLLVSEYPPNVIPSKTHFPFRNRIVSGLSSGVLVIEAKEKSGTLITCDYALDQGKDVFVVPNEIFELNSVGTNNLIKQGAILITSINDILVNFKL